jgi:hypothetical protein
MMLKIADSYEDMAERAEIRLAQKDEATLVPDRRR